MSMFIHQNYLHINRDIAIEISDSSMTSFCDSFPFKGLVKEPICYKNLNNLSRMDFLINPRKRFISNTVIENGFSDFHKLTVTVLKTTFQKMAPIILIY